MSLPRNAKLKQFEDEHLVHRLFNSLDKEGDGEIFVDELVASIIDSGICIDDPRLHEVIESLGLGSKVFTSKKKPRIGRLMSMCASLPKLDVEQFGNVISSNISLVEKILSGDLTVPDWGDFVQDMTELYNESLQISGGANADYIPQLAKVDPTKFAISVCTVDGQRFSIGDAHERFCVQSCSKPINYCLALEERGLDSVLEHIGFEPSGQSFNKLTLNSDQRPHNPCVNAGGIMSCSLFKQGREQYERFEHCQKMWKRLSGGADIGFDNLTYLSEKATADRNFCLGYMMRECGAFPAESDLIETLQLYFMCCSLTISCDDFAVVGATLANGGIVPVTDDKVLDAETVRSCLSIMYSCGMYDYSGEWAFRIGLPAKSGVSGCIIAVIPGFGGISVWSPPLDEIGNSVRGVGFFKKLVQRFNFHHFDSLTIKTTAGEEYKEDLAKKKDPRQRKDAEFRKEVVSLLYAAAEGNVRDIKRISSLGLDLSSSDYDGRTALHLAASENQEIVVQYLLKRGANPAPVDRWGGTPLDDSLRVGNDAIADMLRTAMEREGNPATSE